MDTAILKEIGLTESEIKVYLALLETGSAKKGIIVKVAGIASSKIYEVMDKLIEKGLASYVLKGNVRYFNAAPASRIRDYLKEKEEKLKAQDEKLGKILPELLMMQKAMEKKADAEVYRGWKGMQAVYNNLIESLKKGEDYYIFGASKGADEKKVRAFYTQFNRKVLQKGLKAHIIFNEEARNNIPNAEKTGKVRYISFNTPSETLIYGNKTAIVLLEKEPLVILLHGESIARSFRAYFDIMWKQSKF